MSSNPGDATAAMPPRGSSPHLTIGMPAYNSEATIAEAISCLLSQTCGDFELIVSDNASSDRTVAIVEDMAALDSRLHLVRQSRNIGANENYSVVARAARGKYFKWASSNDWCAPTFVERCLALLDRHPDAVIAYPATRLFERNVSEAVDYPDDIDAVDEDPVARLSRVLQGLRLNNAINGVIRANALRQTRLIEHYPGADVVLLGHLALLGRIHLLPEKLFYRRMDDKTATRMMGMDGVMRHHYPSRTARSLFPSWRQNWAWSRVALSPSLSGAERRRALGIISRGWRHSRQELLGDIVAAIKFPFTKPDLNQAAPGQV